MCGLARPFRMGEAEASRVPQGDGFETAGRGGPPVHERHERLQDHSLPQATSSSSAFASCKSAVSKPSVNHP